MRWLFSRGWHGWALVGLVVLVFDVGAAWYGGESMTEAMRRWVQHGAGRWVVGAFVVYLTLHLTVLPSRVDPLDRGYAWLKARRAQPVETERYQHVPGGNG